jgi:membrane fusion protein, heavy metal efflux system
MALKGWTLLFAVVCVTAGCSRPASPPPSAEEADPLSVTRWTDKTELFAEYPALVAGQTSRFAIHLTRLDTFKALTDGTVEVRLEGGGQPQTFRVEEPSRPGIFGVDVTPGASGARELVIALRSKDITDEHRVGRVEIYANAGAAKAAAPEAEATPGISFLKEQQWTLEFGTAVVGEEALQESIRVPAVLEPRPGGAADVIAPIQGRLVTAVALPVGAAVTRGQELARIAPPAAVPGDLPQLQRARAEADTSLALAIRDRERAERLTAAGAAPDRRLDEARSAETQARTRLAAAEASLSQYQAARSGESSNDDGLFVVRAPVGGVIANRNATTGANVTAGASLFQIVDVSSVHVVGRIPEADAVRARQARAAELEVTGQVGRLSVGSLVSTGKVIEPQSRTLPITFAFDNTRASLPLGQSLFLHLLMDSTGTQPVVPAEAVVDDAGRPIVFVQREGETFERRAVTIGTRNANLVQITEGLKPGERVVTKGAYLVRLASLSTVVPAHGHVH